MNFSLPNFRFVGLFCLALLVAAAARAESPANIAGLFEIDLISATHDGFNKGKTVTDLQLRKAQLDFNVTLNSTLSGKMIMLYEEGDERQFKIDEAFLVRSLGDGQFSLKLGYMIIPFGTFVTNMVTDPLTLELAEAREDALIATFKLGEFSTSAYFFNGDKDQQSDIEANTNSIDSVGIQVRYEVVTDHYGFVLSGGYMSDMAEPDKSTIATGYAGDQIPGAAIGVEATFAEFNFFAEHITATEAFTATALSFNGQAATPMATLMEFGYKKARMQTSIGYQSTHDALALNLPSSRNMLTLAYEMDPECLIALEYMTQQDYPTSAGGSGEKSTQLTLEWTATF